MKEGNLLLYQIQAENREKCMKQVGFLFYSLGNKRSFFWGIYLRLKKELM